MSDSDFSLVGGRIALKQDLDRRSMGDLLFPLGVFPCGDDVKMIQGYESRAQVGSPGLSDHIEFRVVASPKTQSEVFKTLLDDLMPPEAYGIYEEFSFDAYRDTDSYMSTDPIALERLQGVWATFSDFIVEDGKTGFGVVCFEPCIEVFVEEHGGLYISGAVEFSSRIEAILEGMGIPQVNSLRTIDNFQHQHREVLQVEQDNDATMDEIDIKFSLIEGLGMQPTNRDEGIPDALPTPYWVQVELDLTFRSDSVASGAYASYGVTADSHDEALALVEQQVLKVPGALMARVLDAYRLLDDDIGDDICPTDRSTVNQPGIWFNSELQLWA